MLPFLTFLTEKRNSFTVSNADNTRVATAGERYTVAHILRTAAVHHRGQGNHDKAQHLETQAAEHEARANVLMKGIDPAVHADTKGRAIAVAAEFVNRMKQAGHKPEHIHGVHHTPNPGDITRVTSVATNQTDDPSDLVVHYRKGNDDYYHGISYKNNVSHTLGTPGSKVIDALLGTRHEENHTKFHQEMRAKHGDAWASKQSRKVLLADSEEARKDVDNFRKKTAHHQTTTFNGVDTETQRAFLKNQFKMNSKIDYTLAKGYGTNGNYGAKISDHDDHPLSAAIKNAVKFSAEQRGHTTHYYAHDKKGNAIRLGYNEHRFTHSGATSFGHPMHSVAHTAVD